MFDESRYYYNRIVPRGTPTPPPLDLQTLNWRRLFFTEDLTMVGGAVTAWPGRPSTGTSGLESAIGGNANALGVPLNGIQTLQLNGVQAIGATNNANAFNATATPTNTLGAPSFFYFSVINWNPAGAPNVSTPGTFYQNVCLFGDNNFRLKATNRNGKAQIYYYDGTLGGVECDMPNSQWSLILARSRLDPGLGNTLTEIRCGSAGLWIPSVRTLPVAAAIQGPIAIGDASGSGALWRGMTAAFGCGYEWRDNTVSDAIIASLSAKYNTAF